MHKLIRYLLLSLALISSLTQAAAEHDTVTLSDEADMDLRHFEAQGDTMIIGFPCDLGSGRAEASSGQVLSHLGIEVWLADLLGAHFLPIAPSSMRSLQGDEVSRLIAFAASRNQKRIILVASGYGAIPALRGARIWQQKNPDNKRLVGAILFFPMLTSHNPEPGKPLQYLDIVHKTNLPIVIMQPTNTPTRFWVNKLKTSLERGGSRVQVKFLSNVRSHFYSRPDATEEEMAMANRLPELVQEALTTLRTMEKSP